MMHNKYLTPGERLARSTVEHPPWILPRGEETPKVDRGIHAAFKRWKVPQQEPSVEMLAAVWKNPQLNTYGLRDTDLDEAVRRAALILHLYAVASDDGQLLDNLGAACAHHPAGSLKSVVAEGRFARLVNTPPPWSLRLSALARLSRRFRAAGIRIRAEDSIHMLRFVFSPDAKRTIAHWANGYYHVETSDNNEIEAGATSEK